VRSEPLAGASGHALEIAAAAAVLRGEGDQALRERVIQLADAAAEAAGVAQGAAAALDDGRALATATRWVEAQGGDPAALTDPALLVQALLQQDVVATASGRVQSVDAGVVGRATRWLGAGRLDPDQVIDPAVGVEIVARAGEMVHEGDVLGVIHASDSWLADRAIDMLADAWVIAGA
jgi:thymidine phosphorylase